MTKSKLNQMSIADRNLELAMEFNRHVLEHPEITDQLPKKATIILLPQDDPELCAVNKRIAESRIKQGDEVVLVNIEKIRIQFEGISFRKPSKLEEVAV